MTQSRFGRRQMAQAGQRRGHAAVGEAHAVDQGAVLRQPENARAGVAALRARRQRADFDVAKAKAGQPGGNAGVFVKAGGDAENIGKSQAAAGNRPVGQRPGNAAQQPAPRRYALRQRQRVQRHVVGALGVDAANKREEAIRRRGTL